jgi:hypothetical protein
MAEQMRYPDSKPQTQVEEEDSELGRRAEYTSKLLSSKVGSGSENRFIRTLSFLLSSQSDEGYWGSPNWPMWQPIMTVQVIELLSRSGMPLNSEWLITTATSRERRVGSTKKAFDWLISVQNEDGSWGEDFFDTCQVVKAMLSAGYRLDFPELRKALDYLRQAISEDWQSEAKKPWFGPGFYAAGVEVFSRLRNQAFVDSLISQILESQDPETGKFYGPKDGAGNYLIACEWHTSQVLMALYSIEPILSRKIAQALDWLISVQNEDGSWGGGWQIHIYTANAVVALATLRGREFDPVRKGFKWFLNRQEPSGRILDLGVTCMAAWMFSRILGDELSTSLPVSLVLDTMDLTRRQQAMIDRLYDEKGMWMQSEARMSAEKQDLEKVVKRLAAENARLREVVGTLRKQTREYEEQIESVQNKLSSYWIRLTDRQIAVIGFAVGIIGLALAVITLLF